MQSNQHVRRIRHIGKNLNHRGRPQDTARALKMLTCRSFLLISTVFFVRIPQVACAEMTRIENDLVAPPRVERITLSRNGTAIFFIARHASQASLWAKYVGKPTRRVMTWSSEELNFQVSADGHSALLLKRDAQGAWSLSLLNPMNGGRQKIPLPNRIAGFGLAGRDGFKVLTQDADFHLDLVTLDFSTGGPLTTTDLGEAEDVGYGVDGNVHLARTADGNWMRTAQGTPKTPFSNDGLGTFVGTNDEGSLAIFMASNRAEFSNYELVNTVTASRSLLEGSPHADIVALLRSPFDGGIDGYLKDGRQREWVSQRSTLQKTINHIQQVIGLVPHILMRSDDDNVWLVIADDTSVAPHYYLFNRLQDSLAPLNLGSERSTRNPPPPIVHEDPIDGFVIESWASPPLADACNPQRVKCPFVVKLHGGPHHKDGREYDPETRWLQSLGFWVLRVNFRGSTGFGERFANASNREWGGRVISDILSGLRWLKTLKGVDAKRGIALGSSFGGFAATALATTDPTSVQCVASLNGGGDLMAFATIVPIRSSKMAEDIRKEVGDPSVPEDRYLIEKQSPVSHIANSNVKYLIEYGAKDTISPPEESSDFAEALASKNKFIAIRYDEEGHELIGKPSRQLHYALLKRFLNLCRGDAPLHLSPLQTSPIGVTVTADPFLGALLYGTR